MAFSKKSEKLVNNLIQAEYDNACENYGDKYNSLHEAYAVLLEEVEEVEEQLDEIKLYLKMMWREVKYNDTTSLKATVEDLLEINKHTMQELAQVGAVLLKWENTLEVEE